MVSLTATCGTTHKPSITKTLSYETELARDLQKVDESCDDNFALLMATKYAEEDQQLMGSRLACEVKRGLAEEERGSGR